MGNLENSKVRIKALLKELDRLQLEVRKKKTFIRVIIAVLILLSVVTCSFFYTHIDEVKPKPIQVKRNDGDMVKKANDKPQFLKIYQLAFDSLNQYPLARFINKEKAFSFQEEIKTLHLPKTHINMDSLDGKERVLAISSNYRYYIQVGIFKTQLFSDLPENMVYLHQIKDKNLYKYRLGPFTKIGQAKHLVRDLNLKDYLIVEVSN
ncbi:SPOR domain-containing protein [Ancylomarina sp. 16SWW S1-10-2]|uniref:SPOR domain-containing protein n=1 Tax=Ancylomarina sp. 16SWW S1-10-2 TaxID=2499681 RepID=UPI0012ADBB0C|nr:SPOR domain-containing protein [Ancylomarina sp. 16SWW S1-10-2]MRT91650.1 SPOR domain-containing protein [Ancylomarina sp. 16SWW S1-10-2]